MDIKKLIFIATLALSQLTSPLKAEPRWDWDQISKETNNFSLEHLDQLSTISFWGAASSCLQTSGLQTTSNALPVENNWTVWLAERNKSPIGTACESWTNSDKDIACLKQAGLNTYRFSIEWSKVEPQKGQFNTEALDWYINFINALIKAGIKPIPTLFHHAWPLWFEYTDEEDRGRAFEDEQNVDDFVAYATYTFAYIMQRVTNKKMVDTWISLNEPIGYAMAAYIDGSYPPGEKRAFCLCGRVSYNMLQAHNRMHTIFHDFADLKKFEVNLGLAKVFNPIQPYTWYNPCDISIAYYMNYLLNHAAVEYYKTGHFSWCSTLPYGVSEYDKNAPNALDFIGVNYYSHTLIGNFKPCARPEEIMSFSPDPKKHRKALYAEGFYDAIKLAASIGKPVWITENGFATSKVEDRTTFFQRHFYVLNKVIQEGIPIHGYLFWTLIDGYEWNAGESNYGLFDKNRKLKPSALFLVETVKALLN